MYVDVLIRSCLNTLFKLNHCSFFSVVFNETFAQLRDDGEGISSRTAADFASIALKAIEVRHVQHDKDSC